MTAADASSPSFPHLARGCPRARRRPWRGIPERAFATDVAEVWTLGHRGAVVCAEREVELVAPPGARSAHLSQTSLEAAAVPGTYTRRERSSTLRVVQSVDGWSPSACRAALRRLVEHLRTRPCTRRDMST